MMAIYLFNNDLRWKFTEMKYSKFRIGSVYSIDLFMLSSLTSLLFALLLSLHRLMFLLLYKGWNSLLMNQIATLKIPLKSVAWSQNTVGSCWPILCMLLCGSTTVYYSMGVQLCTDFVVSTVAVVSNTGNEAWFSVVEKMSLCTACVYCCCILYCSQKWWVY